MESYLLGEDMWEVVGGDDKVALIATKDNPNVDAIKRWKTSNANAEFVLKRSLSQELFDHIVGCKSASEI